MTKGNIHEKITTEAMPMKKKLSEAISIKTNNASGDVHKKIMTEATSIVYFSS